MHLLLGHMSQCSFKIKIGNHFCSVVKGTSLSVNAGERHSQQ